MKSAYIYVLLTVLSTVTSQILFKKSTGHIESFGEATDTYMVAAKYLNFYFVAGLFFSVASIVSWMFALFKLTLGQAYPYMSLTFPLVLIASCVIFGEQVTWLKWIGISFIVFGLVLIAQEV